MTFPSIDDLNAYGGALKNYAPVEDPTTDRDADEANQAYASTAAMTHTAVRAWARFVTSATTPALTNTNSNDSGWGNTSATLPVPARSSAGVFTMTWPTTIVDELGETHTLNFRWAKVFVEGATLAFAQATVTAPNVATIRLFNTSFAAADLAGTTLLVQVG